MLEELLFFLDIKRHTDIEKTEYLQAASILVVELISIKWLLLIETPAIYICMSDSN